MILKPMYKDIFYIPCIASDWTVPHLLKLADRFQMEFVMCQSEKYLIQSKGFDEVQKLIFADKYKLAALKDHCLQSPDLIEKLKVLL
ncbi:hypothetical protein PMAYCL1PPCAC_25614, partial [Pristionchus mayeri]